MENKTCKLIPLVGMELDGQPIPFGCTRADAEAVLGPAEAAHGARCYYLGSELALDFDDAGKLNFIECLGGIDGALQPEICGVPAFGTDADELCALLEQHNGGQPLDEEDGYSYSYQAIGVGLYREITPADVDGMLLEMSNMNLENLGGVDVDEELKKAHHWATVGIGTKDYYA